jgi:cyclopropane fatty-acyl-phospholipid synthase-like methyltransferase
VSRKSEVRPEPIPSSLYDEEYFADVEGYRVFQMSHGTTASLRLQVALQLGDICPGDRVLDVGCGRGEVLIQAGRLGAIAFGIDYSAASADIAHRTTLAQKTATATGVSQANSKALPFANAAFDRVFLLDIVEHLHPWELEQTLTEVRRVLQPEGQCVIHTMPNLWYYRFGYPIYRLLQRLRGVQLPADPRHRFRYHAAMHVNEQDVLSLKANLHRAGFTARVWATNVQPYAQEYGQLGAMVDWLCRFYPFKWILCNDLFAIASPIGEHL